MKEQKQEWEAPKLEELLMRTTEGGPVLGAFETSRPLTGTYTFS